MVKHPTQQKTQHVLVISRCWEWKPWRIWSFHLAFWEVFIFDFGVNFQDPDSSALPHVQETPKPEVALDASQISFSFSDPGAVSGWKNVQGKAKNYSFQVSMVNSKTPLSKNSAIWRWFPFTIIGEISQRSRNHFFKIYLALYPYSEVTAVPPSVHQYFHHLFLSGCVYKYIYMIIYIEIEYVCMCVCSLSSFPSIRPFIYSTVVLSIRFCFRVSTHWVIYPYLFI